MNKLANSILENEMIALREGIRNRYKAYHRRDRDRYPDFEFNSNRANYQPLRDSFEEEFFEVRKIDRVNNHLHIPSLNTLAQLFSNDDYVPGKKILNTCRSYAEGKPQAAVKPIPSFALSPQAAVVNKHSRWLITTLLVTSLLAGFVGYSFLTGGKAVPSGLNMQQPAANSVVPRAIIASGTAVNASTVWVVVRAKGGLKYWVQPPIIVKDNETWQGAIYIGSYDKGDVGIRSQVRAFINPVKPLTEGEVLYAWPQAELATAITEVVRANDIDR